jgi:hypothetical protein
LERERGTSLQQRRQWVLSEESIRSKSSNPSKRFERLKLLERFEPTLSVDLPLAISVA